MNFFYGVVLAIVGQVMTFLQLQGSAKLGWYDKHPILVLLASVPIGWFFIKSVNIFIIEYGGEIWPSRLLGFGIGIIVFYLLSYYLFDEPITLKTFVCLMLSATIIGIQIFWK